MYDCIIVGAGPAGITAGIYAARKGMNVLVISRDIGGQTAWSGDIENYTGYQFITGPDLTSKFEEHILKYKVKVNEGKEAIEVKRTGGKILVRTAEDSYRAGTAIVASGKSSRELDVPGEREFKNKGLTYCATCDGPLFAGRDVAIIGGGNSALDAALQLMNIAKSVCIVNIGSALTADEVMQKKAAANKNVAVLNNSRVTAVLGDKFVTGVKIKSGNKGRTLPVQGVFVEIGLIPNSKFVVGADKNEKGEIRINLRNETSIPGIFAAGDVTEVPEKQIVVAAGEGAKAALGAFRYLARLR